MKNHTQIKLVLISCILLLSTPGFSQHVLNPTDDAYIRGGSSVAVNYGTEVNLELKSNDNESYCRRVLLKFALSGVDEFYQATLRLYASSAKSMPITVFETTDDWDESDVTWNTAPSKGNSIVSTDISSSGVYYEWDVSDYVSAQLSGDGVVSFLLDDETISQNSADFNSKEAGSYIPELVINEKIEFDLSSLPALEDAMVYGWGSSKHVKNYGSNTVLTSKFDGLSKNTIDTYLKFDISSISEPLDTVLLKLYIQSLERSTYISIYAIDPAKTWSESTITGYEKPLANERSGLYELTGTGIQTFDISEVFNKAISNNWSSLTLVIKENEGAEVLLNSREADFEQPEILYGTVTTTYTELNVETGNYFIDSENGSDLNLGTSDAEPWQNISKLNDLTFGPGTGIYLKSGSSWSGQQLLFAGSGSADNPIIVSSYGTGDKPMLKGEGMFRGVIELFNQEYIELSGLKISNEGPSIEGLRRGIYVLADNAGVLSHLHFTNLDIVDVNGTNGIIAGVYGNSDDAQRTGGIYLEVRGDDVKTYFDDVLVDQCYFHNCSNTGLANVSHWSELNIDSDWDDNVVPGTSNADYVHNFVPSTNIVYSRNRFDSIQTQGIIIRTAEDPLMEYNVFYYCSMSAGSDNACFNSKTTGAIWRYNESCYTQWVDDQGDGAGIDSDIRTKNTLIEYNYCHHNGYGGVIATGGRFIDSFNDSTIIRYNILANNGHNTVRICNNNTNALIFNNLIYYDNADDINRLIFQHIHTDAYFGPSNTYVSNNIFYTTNNNGRFMADQLWTDPRVERCNYSNNLFYGIYIDDQYPDDANKVTADPLFVEGTVPEQKIGGYVLLNENGIPTGEIDYNFLTGFKLSSLSPAIDKGIISAYTILPLVDFENKELYKGTSVNIGPFEYDSVLNSNSSLGSISVNNNLSVYPTMVDNKITIEMNGSTNENVIIQIVDINGLVSYVAERTLVSENDKLDINLNALGIKKGVYLIRIIQNGESTSIGKFIKI
jgi:hypothetical protein